jgi:hypothetical protein
MMREFAAVVSHDALSAAAADLPGDGEARKRRYETTRRRVEILGESVRLSLTQRTGPRPDDAVLSQILYLEPREPKGHRLATAAGVSFCVTGINKGESYV